MYALWKENKGSISLFAIFTVIAILMTMFLSINIGNIYAKKNFVEDTADQIGSSLLAHQIKKHLDIPNSITATPNDIANTILTQTAPSLGNDFYITFGVLDTTETFTPLTSLNYSTVAIDPNDPDLKLLTLGLGENFAVNFQLLHEVSPLATLGELLNVSITLQGKSSYATAIETLPDPAPDTKAECCCTTTEPPGETYTFMMFFGGCKYETGSGLFGFPTYTSCDYLFPSPDAICDDFYACQGTFFSNILNGTPFSSFLKLFKCWLADFINKLIFSIRKVPSVVDSWTGWETV